MGLKITNKCYSRTEGTKGDNMSVEQIINRLEIELGANWDDSTDIYGRV